MKRVSAIIVCCLLAVALLALPVLAATPATFTVAANKTTVNPGDTVTVTITIPKMTTKNLGITLLYDSNFFTCGGGSCKLSVGDLKTVNTKNAGKAACAWAAGEALEIEGQAFVVNFTVKDTAAGSTTINFEKQKADGYDVTANAVTIKVNCNHEWGNWTPDGAAGHKRECTKCGEPQTQGHTYGSWSVTTPAGCNTPGEKTRECSVCGYDDVAVVEATGNHVWGAWAQNGAAGHKRECTTCVGTKAVDTATHTYGSWNVTTPAGCSTPGEKTRECSACGYDDVAAVEATGNHVWGPWTKVDDTNHKRECTTCVGTKATETDTHNWGTWVVTDNPDCANPGEKERTCTDNCGAKQTEPVPSTGEHGYGDWTKLDDEYHTRVCTGCGKEPQTEKHTMDAGVVIKPADCKNPGTMKYTCTAKGCGHSYEEPIPVDETKHVWSAWTSDGPENHKRVCTVCDKPETEAHSPSADLHYDATNHWRVCFCGEKLEVTPHAYDETKWAHDDEGHYHACECGAEKPDSKAAHNWDEGVVTKKPTNKKEGEKTFTCTDCGHKRIEKIDKVTTPATGDNTLVIPMVILAVLSACGLAVTVVARKRASR